MTHMTLRLVAAAAAAAAFTQPAAAATELGEYLSFSAFGTLGLVQTNSDEAQYVREQQVKGATKTASALVDSNLGLQLTAKANDWLSATVQTLSAQRYTDEITTRFDWAYVKVTPLENLNIRLGKVALPNFLVSDSRRIGYANTALRPSNEVYGLDLLASGLKGVDASYALRLGGGTLTASVLLGKSRAQTATFDLEANKTRSFNLVWDGDWYTVRLGQTKAEPNLDALLGPGINETYTFNGLGFTVDRAQVVLQGEYVQRRSSAAPAFIEADAWYIQAGYRMGKWLPYASIAERKTKNSIVNPQKTVALGARWDAMSSAAVKFQLERVNPRKTLGASFVDPVSGTLSKSVTTFGMAVDFVY
jgi:Gram-negative porin